MSEAPQVTFAQHRLPPLEAARYTLTVTQEVTVAGTPREQFVATQELHVTGPRYSLPPDTVNAVFPPVGAQGEFSNVLPHVVLSDPTLPWLRDVGAPTPDGRPSWLALMLFDAADPPPSPQQVTIGDLAPTSDRLAAPPDPEPGEDPTAPVTVIDVPIALFTAIAPSVDDLVWAAHVRKADIAQKATQGDTAPPAEYAVVIANRLPAPGALATAHLVSLAGLGPYLPDRTGTPSGAIGGTASAIRLASLHSWSFTAVDMKQTFTDTAAALDMNPPVLRHPDVGVSGGDPVADSNVRDALAMGYTALDHTLRDGGHTVSWYRGPLLPFAGGSDADPPYASADELLRLEPGTGMLDVSDAAAWQLGRLMALRDAAFAVSLYRWKHEQTQQAVLALEQELIAAELSAPSAAGDATARVDHALRTFVQPAAERLAHPGEGG